ncbi:MAG: cation:proton antiporter [Enhydrobacter sp.]|nr:cation:proton antiporter [Enhydrobacter sp.]
MLLVVFSLLAFAYSLVSRRLEATVVTGPIFFTAAGFAVAALGGVELDTRENGRFFLHLAEVGLVLLLFSDAAHTDLSVLWNIRNLPARLLGIGLPLTLAIGALAAWLMLPGVGLWEAAILAAILAPTDAGLGQVIVTDPRAPVSVRQALNVEAGLNDGLAVPFLLFFIALAAVSEGAPASLVRYVVEQLGYGVAVGAGIGLAGGWLLGWASRRDWISDSLRPVGVVALPVLCLLVSEAVSASMFIAAFVAGLAVQKGYGAAGRLSVAFGETWGQLLNLSVFFLFGMIAARSWHRIDLAVAAYAIASLTVVRMLPVAIALIGSGLSRPTVLFMGWFGPRGLASIVLGLVYLESEIHLAGESTIRLAVLATVLLSILAHGASAGAGLALYGRAVDRLGKDAPERRADGRAAN